MEGVGNKEGNGAMDFGVVIAFDEALEGRHEMRDDFLRDCFGLQRIQKPLNDPCSEWVSVPYHRKVHINETYAFGAADGY